MEIQRHFLQKKGLQGEFLIIPGKKGRGRSSPLQKVLGCLILPTLWRLPCLWVGFLSTQGQSWLHRLQGRVTLEAVPYEKKLGEKSRTYHGLLVLIGLDAADKKGLAHAESPHQQLQGPLELAAERRRALPRLRSLQNRSGAGSGNERITAPFPSGCIPGNLPPQPGAGVGSRARGG